MILRWFRMPAFIVLTLFSSYFQRWRMTSRKHSKRHWLFHENNVWTQWIEHIFYFLKYRWFRSFQDLEGRLNVCDVVICGIFVKIEISKILGENSRRKKRNSERKARKKSDFEEEKKLFGPLTLTVTACLATFITKRSEHLLPKDRMETLKKSKLCKISLFKGCVCVWVSEWVNVCEWSIGWVGANVEFSVKPSKSSRKRGK